MSPEVDALLLKRIPTEPARVTTTELIEHLRQHGQGMTPRGVQKRLGELAERHGLRRIVVGKPHQWCFPVGAKEKLFGAMAPHEALALVLAREHLRALLPPRTTQFIEERLRQTERELDADPSGRPSRWRKTVVHVPHELPRIATPPDARVFRNVSEALYDGLQLALDYRKRGQSEPETYALHPLGLCERDGELWLVATKDDDPSRTPRFFLLHRATAAKVQRGKPVRVPPGFDLERLIAEGDAHFVLDLGHAIPLRARFAPGVADKLLERPLHKDQRTSLRRDGWLVLEATVPHTRALVAFLLGYGPLCVVDGPKALRDEIAGLHADAAAQYRR